MMDVQGKMRVLTNLKTGEKIFLDPTNPKVANLLKRLEKFVSLICLLGAMFMASPVFAVDVVMGAGGNLAFEPNEITISTGDVLHFVNEALYAS